MKYCIFTEWYSFKWSNIFSRQTALSDQLAHSAIDLHLKEISEFLHGSEMIKINTEPSELLRLRLSEPIPSESV